MIRRSFLSVLALFALFAVAAPLSTPAQAASLVQAKSAGIVGERTDGLVGIVDNARADGSIRSMVNSVNDQRMQRYRKLAEKHGVPVSEIQKQAALKLIRETPSGQYYMNTSGQWIRK